MTKKKMHEQEENRHKNINKATDNKENADSADNLNSYLNDSQLPRESSDPESDDSEEGNGFTDIAGLQVRAAEEKLAEMQDKYIRLSAEFDNYRKRTLREKMDLSKYAEESLLLKIIPLMDDFERAMLHMDNSENCSSMKDGIELIYLKFSEFLKQNGIKEIDALNSNFDVDLHEAIAKVPVDNPDKIGKVMDVVLKGYYLQDKVIRFAKVVVGE